MEKTKILIVEDEKITHARFAKGLEDEYEIVHAFDGAEALMSAAKDKPALILLDIMIPLVDGRTVCRKLKSHPETEDIKIVMLTGKDEQYERIAGLEAGADEYIEKPCDIPYLKRIIAKILRQ